jgi:sugar O-acyltransferase (sialic acid O-acetyltransferase NeuD family)
MSKWTILGTSDLMLEMIDAIYDNGDELHQIVINMPIPEKSILDFKEYNNIIKIEDYQPNFELNIFGFTNCNKDAFLKVLPVLVFANLIHPVSYHASTAHFGWGNYIAAGAVIGAKVSLKCHNIVNRNASIGHHTEVDSFNNFGPGSVICGRCKIGCKNFFGAGSIVKDQIRIGNNVTIGAGAVVVNDILESGTYVGIPAKRFNPS